MKCVAGSKCPWTIFASYSKQVRGIQVKSFNDKHTCGVSFINKIVNVAMIVKHFAQTIKYHSKLRLMELKQKVKTEMHAKVDLIICRRPKKMALQKFSGIMKMSSQN